MTWCWCSRCGIDHEAPECEMTAGPHDTIASLRAKVDKLKASLAEAVRDGNVMREQWDIAKGESESHVEANRALLADNKLLKAELAATKAYCPMCALLKHDLATARDKVLTDCAAWVTQHCGPVEGVELLEALSRPAPVEQTCVRCRALVTPHDAAYDGQCAACRHAPAPAEPPNRIEKQATSDTVAGAGRAERGAIERGIAPGDEALCNSGTPSPATGQGEMELAQRPVKGGG